VIPVKGTTRKNAIMGTNIVKVFEPIPRQKSSYELNGDAITG
jgi:hypothetical protein